MRDNPPAYVVNLAVYLLMAFLMTYCREFQLLIEATRHHRSLTPQADATQEDLNPLLGFLLPSLVLALQISTSQGSDWAEKTKDLGTRVQRPDGSDSGIRMN
jgi:hypothetical protein